MGVPVQLSPATRRAQARYAAALRNHPDDAAQADAARRAWAVSLAADLRARADALDPTTQGDLE
jgi:hypothetical protein